MIPFKNKPNGILKNTAAIFLIILLCLTDFSFCKQRDDSRRVAAVDIRERSTPKDETNRSFVTREVVEMSPYVRDVRADSRQSRIDARDIRTDFREIRTELRRSRDPNNNLVTSETVIDNTIRERREMKNFENYSRQREHQRQLLDENRRETSVMERRERASFCRENSRREAVRERSLVEARQNVPSGTYSRIVREERTNSRRNTHRETDLQRRDSRRNQREHSREWSRTLRERSLEGRRDVRTDTSRIDREARTQNLREIRLSERAEHSRLANRDSRRNIPEGTHLLLRRQQQQQSDKSRRNQRENSRESSHQTLRERSIESRRERGDDYRERRDQRLSERSENIRREDSRRNERENSRERTEGQVDTSRLSPALASASASEDSRRVSRQDSRRDQRERSRERRERQSEERRGRESVFSRTSVRREVSRDRVRQQADRFREVPTVEELRRTAKRSTDVMRERQLDAEFIPNFTKNSGVLLNTLQVVLLMALLGQVFVNKSKTKLTFDNFFGKEKLY